MITSLKIGYNGRFGNQIFQFASLIGIADKMGFDVKIPKTNLEISKSQTLMNGQSFNSRFELCDLFNIDMKYFDNSIIVSKTIYEKHFHFDPDFFKISDFIDINGYFQSEKYFEHCSDKIKKELTIKPEFLKLAKKSLPKFNKELVSIHIRRGDYTHPNPYHPLNGLDYVNSALTNFRDDRYHFVVISDDKDWCRRTWENNDRFTILDTNSSFVDFTAMSLCQHHIISNSSFSWWASYLSKNIDKKIVAPKNWFGPGLSQNNTKDLYTKNMIVV